MQYTIAFWSITSLALVPFFVLVLLAILNPFWFRSDMLNWVEKLATALGTWRDEKTFVKHYYDKAHLFHILKD